MVREEEKECGCAADAKAFMEQGLPAMAIKCVGKWNGTKVKGAGRVEGSGFGIGRVKAWSSRGE